MVANEQLFRLMELCIQNLTLGQEVIPQNEQELSEVLEYTRANVASRQRWMMFLLGKIKENLAE